MMARSARQFNRWWRIDAFVSVTKRALVQPKLHDKRKWLKFDEIGLLNLFSRRSEYSNILLNWYACNWWSLLFDKFGIPDWKSYGSHTVYERILSYNLFYLWLNAAKLAFFLRREIQSHVYPNIAVIYCPVSPWKLNFSYFEWMTIFPKHEFNSLYFSSFTATNCVAAFFKQRI